MRPTRLLAVLLIVVGVLVLLYPTLYLGLVWLYCVTDDYVLRPDAGRWRYQNGTFWHTYNFEDGSDGEYDRQIDLSLPYFDLGYGRPTP